MRCDSCGFWRIQRGLRTWGLLLTHLQESCLLLLYIQYFLEPEKKGGEARRGTFFGQEF